MFKIDFHLVTRKKIGHKTKENALKENTSHRRKWVTAVPLKEACVSPEKYLVDFNMSQDFPLKLCF